MDERDRQNLVVAVVVIVLVVASYWLMTELRRRGQVEDCLMQRRRDCDALLQR